MLNIRNFSKRGQSPVPYGTGQSLVEVLVSLSVAAAVLSAIAVAVVYSLRNTQFSKNQNLASQYAAQGIEAIRQIRNNASTLSKYRGGYCIPQDATELDSTKVPPCGQNVGIYSREVKVEPPETTECGIKAYKTTVTVLWWDNACGATSNFCHKVNLVSCFADRAVVPRP